MHNDQVNQSNEAGMTPGSLMERLEIARRTQEFSNAVRQGAATVAERTQQNMAAAREHVSRRNVAIAASGVAAVTTATAAVLAPERTLAAAIDTFALGTVAAIGYGVRKAANAILGKRNRAGENEANQTPAPVVEQAQDLEQRPTAQAERQEMDLEQAPPMTFSANAPTTSEAAPARKRRKTTEPVVATTDPRQSAVDAMPLIEEQARTSRTTTAKRRRK